MGSFTSRRAMTVPALAMAILVLAPLRSSPAWGATEGHPIVTTGAAWAVGTSVELDGSVNPHGLATTYYFQYGPTTAYGSQTTPAELHEATEKEKVSQLVTSGMRAGYHYRLVAHNARGERQGKDRTFTGAAKKTKQQKHTKQTKNVLELSGPFAPTLAGGTFVMRGTLTGSGNAGREVVLQDSPYPYTAPFADVGGPALTGAGGGFAFRIAHLSRSTRFRIATVGAPTVYSDVLTQLAEVRVTLNVQSSKRVKGLVRLYGTVSPAAVGSHVFFQLEHTPKPKPVKSEKPEKKPRSEETERPPTFATKFNTVVKRATRSMSRFSVVVKIKDAGYYRAYVELPPGPLASGQSETILLQAGPAKKGKGKKTGAGG